MGYEEDQEECVTNGSAVLPWLTVAAMLFLVSIYAATLYFSKVRGTRFPISEKLRIRRRALLYPLNFIGTNLLTTIYLLWPDSFDSPDGWFVTVGLSLRSLLGLNNFLIYASHTRTLAPLRCVQETDGSFAEREIAREARVAEEQLFGTSDFHVEFSQESDDVSEITASGRTLTESGCSIEDSSCEILEVLSSSLTTSSAPSDSSSTKADNAETCCTLRV